MGNTYTNLNNSTAINNSLSKFYGFYDTPYRDPFISGNAFVFMTKPLLFLQPTRPVTTESKKVMAFINMSRDPYFNQFLTEQCLNKTDRTIIQSLIYDPDTTIFSSNFLPLITNECKNFDAQDTTLEQNQVFDTKQGFNQPLPTHKTLSEAANQISISVTEDANLSFTKMMGLWVNYISNITDGTFDANPDMILNGELDYMSSIYYFVLEPDGRTLKYWCKYTGCWPLTIPYGGLKYSRGSQDVVEIDLQFQYTTKEDMSPRILEDFNTVSLKLTDYANGRLPSVGVNSYYASIKDSPLLNRDVMLQDLPEVSHILTASSRDPLIFYKKASDAGLNVDSTDAHFELLFDDYGYQSDLMSPILDGQDNYFINDTATNSFVKSGQEAMIWNQSGFWDDSDE